MHTHRYVCVSARFLARIHRSRMKLKLKFLMLVLLARKALLRDTAHLLFFQTHLSLYSFFHHLLQHIFGDQTIVLSTSESL